MSNGIAIRGLHKRFGSLTAVANLDLDVAEGEILGFVGPNGAGKTTTISMLAGLLLPTRGEVVLHGHTVGRRARSRRVRRLVGLCPQENVLYPELTAAQNLRYAATLYGMKRRERNRAAEALLAQVGLTGKAKTLAGKLSGGMRRRLTLAMAVVHDPPIVILDEPEAGLDPQSRVAVRDFITSMKGKRTVLLTSHNMDEVERLADRVALIDHGKLVALGTPDELRRTLGDGDTLEITVAPGDAAHAAASIQASLGRHAVQADATDEVVIVRGLDLARRLPTILAALGGTPVNDVRYRSNNLEDVFLHLTGRRLRE